jgi:hypothetical protein
MSEGREGKAELATIVPQGLAWPEMADEDPVDVLEALLMTLPERIDAPLVHRFTPGLYVREIFMPKGAIIISKIHKTEHPYTVSKGWARVFDGKGIVDIRAPYTGITKPGTRRVLLIVEDCIWTTYHPSNETDLDKLEEQLIQPHVIEKALIERVRECSLALEGS